MNSTLYGQHGRDRCEKQQPNLRGENLKLLLQESQRFAGCSDRGEQLRSRLRGSHRKLGSTLPRGDETLYAVSDSESSDGSSSASPTPERPRPAANVAATRATRAADESSAGACA